MTGTGSLGPEIERAGVECVGLGLPRGMPEPAGLWRFHRLLRRTRPDVVMTWLYHADLLGLLARQAMGVPHLVWNLRCSDMRLRPLNAAVRRLLEAKRRYGIRHVIRGVVRNCQGKPIVFGRIDVYNIVHGKRHLMKTGLRTRQGGKLTMITPLNYSSRLIEFTYRGLINKPKVAARQVLRIVAVSRNGRRV